ncbi:UPF0764 protein C16orf89 [Plecturocebus cupreus]
MDGNNQYQPFQKHTKRDIASLCCPGWSAVGVTSAHCNFHLPGSNSHSVVQAGMQWHNLSSLQPLPPGFRQFSYLSLPIEAGFHCIGQAGLELLTSGDPPASASQSTGVTSIRVLVCRSMVTYTHVGTNTEFGYQEILIARRRNEDLGPGFHSDAQVGEQWHKHGSLQPQIPRLKRSYHLSLQVARTTGACYHAHLIFKFFVEMGVSLCCPAWSQTLEFKQSSHLGLPKYWDYRHEPSTWHKNIPDITFKYQNPWMLMSLI